MNNEKQKEIKGTVFKNLIWRFAERSGAQIVTFIVSIVLGRLLDPQVYGLIAIVTIFTSILQVFVDSGLGNALIQKKDADDIDFSTVFYTNIVFCILLYGLIYIAAPIIAWFYANDDLILLIRVLGLMIVVSGVKNVQQAYVSKHMLFKKFFYSTLGGTIGSAVIGILMAVNGYGVWSLVAQQLFSISIDTIILWFTVKWRPKRVFSFSRLKKLYSYAWKLLLSSLIENVYQNLRQLVIGKMYTSADLAYYNRGKQFPQLIISNVNVAIDSVLLPAMSGVQEQRDRVKNMTRRSMKTSMFIIAPIMIGLYVVAPSLVSILLTDKWLPCVPYMQVFCIAFMFLPVSTANLNAINAIGRSDIYLKLEIFKKIVGIVLLLVSMKMGVFALAISYLISTIISQIINAYPNSKLLGYTITEQVKDIIPIIVLAVTMGVIVWSVVLLNLPTIVTLVLQIVVGCCTYVILAKIFKVEAYEYLLEFATPLLKKIFNGKKEL